MNAKKIFHLCQRKLMLITVEPVILLFFFTGGIAWPTTAALWYRRVCMTLYHNTTVCDNLTDNELFKEEEETVQKLVSRLQFGEMCCLFLPATFISLVLGAWSDKYNRQLPMLLPICGQIINSSFSLMNALFMESPLWYMYVGSFLNGLTGISVSLLTSAFSYLSDISTEKNRTVRISMVEAMIPCALAVGSAISGVLLDSTSFKTTFLISLFFPLINLIYITVAIKDTRNHVIEKKINQTSLDNEKHLSLLEHEEDNISDEKPLMAINYHVSQADCNNEFTSDQAITQGISSDGPLLSSNNTEISTTVPYEANKDCNQMQDHESTREKLKLNIFLETIQCLMKKREGKKRQHLIIVIVATLIIHIGWGGDTIYLFLRHPPLAWSQTLYGFFSSFINALNGICCLIVLPILVQLGFRDTSICIIALIGNIAFEFLFGVSTKTWQIFTVSLFGLISSNFWVSSRSFITKTVERDEAGKLLSLFSSVQSLGNALASGIYQLVLYPATVAFFPGFCLEFGGVLSLISLGLIIWLHIDVSKQRKCPEYNILKQDDITEIEVSPHNDDDQQT